MSLIAKPWAFIGHVILTTFLWTTTSSFVMAVSDHLTSEYCLPFERFAPDGKVYKIGERYIRTCHPILGEPTARRGLLKVNLMMISGLNLERRYLAITLTDRVSYELSVVRLAQTLPHKASRNFGEIVYKAHETEVRGENGKPGRGLYVYQPKMSDDHDGLQPHFISCGGEAVFRPPPGFSCNVHIDYKGIRAQHLFLINLEGGKTTEAIMDRFPEVPEDLTTILEFADYTDRMDELPDGIEIIE